MQTFLKHFFRKSAEICILILSWTCYRCYNNNDYISENLNSGLRITRQLIINLKIIIGQAVNHQ
uniref:Uncharacterized protein n=1 Tax=Onchocerca volvulus TaxID=6282 RepID=A0A8R1TZZ3_ONCVO